jgi:predicted small lipoprotein YifL
MKKITIFLILGLSLISCGKKGSLELPETTSQNYILKEMLSTII